MFVYEIQLLITQETMSQVFYRTCLAICIIFFTLKQFYPDIPINSSELPRLPNEYLMAVGIDAKYGFPYNESLREPIMQFTYNNQHIVTISGITYSYPDQLYAISYPSMDSSSTTQVCYSASMVEDALWETFTVGFSCKRINGMFSLSEQVSDFDIEYYSQDSYSAITHLTVTSCKAELNANIRLTETFKNVANKLPTSYNSETCQYFIEFINLFGTSFTPKAVFGGYVFMDSYYKKAITYSKDSSQISIEVGAQFLMFTTNTSVAWNDTYIGKSLDATYESTLQLYGGSAENYSPNNYDPWVATVPSNPVIVRGSLVSISELLTPLNFDLPDLDHLVIERERLFEMCEILVLLFEWNESNESKEKFNELDAKIFLMDSQITELYEKTTKLTAQQDALNQAINDYLSNGSVYTSCRFN